MLERKALIVDDDVSIRVMLSRILQRSFFQVDLARDGAEAIEKLNENDYSVVLLDLMMPRIDGIGVVNYFLEHAPDKLNNFIVITAFGASALSKVCPPVGRFLEKPFDINTLLREVTECSWLSASGA